MKRRLLLTLSLPLSMAAGVASPALARNDCDVPMASWQSREAVRAHVEALGWRVARIKIDDGCYEVYATDAEGRRFEARINPQTLDVVEIERRHRKHDGEGGEDGAQASDNRDGDD